jgi:hypothetical protein
MFTARSFLLGHLLLVGNYCTFAACWRALFRLLTGASGWQKTARITEPAAPAGAHRGAARLGPRLALAGGAHRMDAPWLTLATAPGSRTAEPAAARGGPPNGGLARASQHSTVKIHLRSAPRLRGKPQVGAYWRREGTCSRPGSGEPGWVCRAVIGETGIVRGDASVGCDYNLRRQA